MTATRPPRGSVFLVEDEVMIRMMVSDMLEELGYVVAAEAGEIGEALRLAESTYFDLAILDVNVNGKVISPVADLIKARNADSYVAIEKGMIEIEKALKPDKPDVAQVTAMVNEVMRLYNEALAAIVKDARARQ